jgi:glycosyltransferase involved in cell wall biosynthesis
VHFEGITNGIDISEGQKQYQVINQNKFFEKWKDVLENEHSPNGKDVFLARDRSGNKKLLLMVDHYVPQFDKDAGSRTVFQYIKLFVNLGFNVKFIGDNFYKHEPYTAILEQMGVEVLYGVYYAQNWKTWVEVNGKYIDYVFLNRPHIAVNYIDEVKEHTNAKIFYYGHDLHFLREQREYKIRKDNALLKSFEKWKKIELELMSKADISYYPSEIEVHEIKKQNPSMNVKAIPAYLFDIQQKNERNIKNTKDIMFIGGFQHKPNVDGVLWYVKDIFPILNKKRPEIKTYILGSNAPEEILRLNSENIVITGFVTDEQLTDYYRNCRLSVVPLRYGAGIKGKVVEAMYNQIPVVTTSVGAEGINGAENCLFIKDDPMAFADEIISLYDDLELLSEISRKEIDVVNESFTTDAAIRAIADDFNL